MAGGLQMQMQEDGDDSTRQKLDGGNWSVLGVSHVETSVSYGGGLLWAINTRL